MRFETKREREQRRKRQKRSAILGMVFAMLVVVGLGVLLWNGKKNIEAKNVEYEKQIKELQEQVDEEKQRTEELNEYKKYVQTKKFAEEIAKDKFVEADDAEDEEIKIVRTKRFGMKPMYPEDACIQMELSGHDFFVFRNAENDEVNVVYKRKGNTYGLIRWI